VSRADVPCYRGSGLGSDEGVLSEVRGLHPLGCITYCSSESMVGSKVLNPILRFHSLRSFSAESSTSILDRHCSCMFLFIRLLYFFYFCAASYRVIKNDRSLALYID